MKGNTPVVFVSSTVYDFRDFRTAIKFWLEQHGYEVRMSDYTDFPQQPDKNSYDSCLRAIDDSDYFVLLIGTRVGGWFDQENKVSITRAEYQYAYERAKQGKLKLVTFVRKEVWDVREDRNELRKYLQGEEAKDLNLSQDSVKKITGAPSKYANDPDAIFEFLKEVGRIPEMKAAVAGKGELPLGNWMYQFSTFREIADGLKACIRITGALAQATLIANLKHELLDNLRKTTEKDNGKIYRGHRHMTAKTRDKFTGTLNGTSTFTGIELGQIGMLLALEGNIGSKISTFALHEALKSGFFLHYKLGTGTYEVGLIQQSLLKLNSLIETLCSMEEKTTSQGWSLLKRFNGHMPGKENERPIDNMEVVAGMLLYDRMYNFIERSIALVRYLKDGNVGHLNVSLRSERTVKEMADDDENPTIEELDALM